MSTEKPKRLGRGLEALISGSSRAANDHPTASTTEADTHPSEGVEKIAISKIRPNPFQPRKEFRPAELRELEDSLRTTGLLQPITLRRTHIPDAYELAAGERRLRAASNLGWTDIPAIVKDLSDQELLGVALIENLQRADLNPLEEAEGYARLLTDFNLTQQAVAELVGKDRSTVANMLRVLNLPDSVRAMLRDSLITLGHARALLALQSESEITSLARIIVTKGLSVREVENRARVRKPTAKQLSEKRTAGTVTQHSQARRIQDELRKQLQTDVRISLTGPDKGTIEISFYSADDLERLLDLMIGHERDLH